MVAFPFYLAQDRSGSLREILSWTLQVRDAPMSHCKSEMPRKIACSLSLFLGISSCTWLKREVRELSSKSTVMCPSWFTLGCCHQVVTYNMAQIAPNLSCQMRESLHVCMHSFIGLLEVGASITLMQTKVSHTCKDLPTSEPVFRALQEFATSSGIAEQRVHLMVIYY